MPIPNPGLVISHGYLWYREHQAGREEGQTDRPSVIVLAVERDVDGASVVTVLPSRIAEVASPGLYQEPSRQSASA